MSRILAGFTAQLRALAARRVNGLMLGLCLGAAALSVATYRRGAMREMPVAVYDHDGTGLSRTLQRALDATPELRVVTDPPPTLDEAQGALVRGDLAAVIVVPDGFTTDVKRGRRAEVVAAVDMANVLIGKTAQRTVQRVLATIGAGVQVSLAEKLGAPRSSALARVVPISATEALPGNPGASYAAYASPAFGLSFAHILVLFLAWTVLWPPAPGRGVRETLGRLAACFAVGLAAALLLTYGLLPLAGLHPASNVAVVAAALAALVAADLLFAAALRAVFRGGLLGFQSTVLLGMLSLMLSGLTWPWDTIPAPLRAVSAAIPFTPFGRALRIFLPAPVGLSALAAPLGWMGMQCAGYLAVIAAAALLERLLGAPRAPSAAEPEADAVTGEGARTGALAACAGSLAEEWAILFGRHPRMARAGVLTVLLAIPLLYPGVVAYLYHAEEARERPALLLDLDRSALSRRLALDLEAAPEIRFVGGVASLDEGRAALERGDAELLVVVPADLSRDVKRGARAQVAVWSPGGNVYTWSLAFTAASNVVAAENAVIAAGRFQRMGLPPAAARLRAAPIAAGDRRLFHPSGGYGRYLAVGVILVVLQQLVLISLAFSAGVRRERGVAVGAPPHPLAHLSGMALAHLPFWLGGAAFVGLVLLPWLGWAGPSALSTFGLLALFVAAMAPMSVAVASLVPDRISAFQVLMFLSVPLFVASGFTWPAAQLPRAVEVVTWIFPVTPALRAMRVLSMKSGDLRAVLPELAWLLSLGLAWAGAAAVLVRHPRPWRRAASALTAVPET